MQQLLSPENTLSAKVRQSELTSFHRKPILFPQQLVRGRSVASKYTCSCGQVVRTNLYEGHGLRLLVPEELTDLSTSEMQGSRIEYVDAIVAKSKVVAECSSCGTVAFIDSAYGIRLYAPVAPKSTQPIQRVLQPGA